MGPLPGLEVGHPTAASSVSTGVSTVNAETQAKHDGEMNGECSSSSSGGAWESKLSDVVKGVAKAKAAHNHHHPNHLQAQKPLLNGPPALAVTVNVAATVTSSIPKGSVPESQACPSLPHGDLAQSMLALTPPTSPGKKDRPFHALAAKANKQNQQLKGWPKGWDRSRGACLTPRWPSRARSGWSSWPAKSRSANWNRSARGGGRQQHGFLNQ